MFEWPAGAAVLAMALVPSRTWYVDAAGGGDYRDIQSAIDAASDGDLILVAPGEYAGFVLDRKVAVQAQDESFTVLSTIDVVGIPAGPGRAAVVGATGDDGA
jgi:pectin methylesterase-like acyl-CoA thioesterase